MPITSGDSSTSGCAVKVTIFTFKLIVFSDIDECKTNPCQENAECVNTEGSYDCDCVLGYRPENGGCVDVNECMDNPCMKNALCLNTLGSFQCQCKGM